MADKITKNYKVAASGILNVYSNGKLTIELEDKGEINLTELLVDFDGKSIKFSCSYDEEYVANEDNEDVSVDVDTGELL